MQVRLLLPCAAAIPTQRDVFTLICRYDILSNVAQRPLHNSSNQTVAIEFLDCWKVALNGTYNVVDTTLSCIVYIPYYEYM